MKKKVLHNRYEEAVGGDKTENKIYFACLFPPKSRRSGVSTRIINLAPIAYCTNSILTSFPLRSPTPLPLLPLLHRTWKQVNDKIKKRQESGLLFRQEMDSWGQGPPTIRRKVQPPIYALTSTITFFQGNSLCWFGRGGIIVKTRVRQTMTQRPILSATYLCK